MRCSAIAIAFLAFTGAAMAAESLTAQAAVSHQDVFVGESFRLQIQVSGSEKPEKPDLNALDGCEARYLGGRRNSSQSISIVNGKMQRQVRRGYVFSYQLTPTRAGPLVIPSIPVRGNGQVAQTQPLTIQVKEPMETDDFKLRMRLSKDRCYVGETVTLTVTWYIGQDVRGFEFAVPILNNAAVFHANPEMDTSRGGPYYRIPLGGEEVIGEKGRGTLDGKEYATISFSRILIPRKAGPLTLASAVVSCEALAGYRENRQRSPFGDDFFSGFFRDDFFGRSRRGVYRRVSVPSNELTLDVRPLPAEGRPAGFAGHVGTYRITTSASPTDVRVGDPITLTVSLSGPAYLEHVTLPPLHEQDALAAAFRIPSEMSEGELRDGKKIFTQTIRALRPDVEEVPPLELPYFDVQSETYSVARSEAIPLNVEAARVVTAEDAEGREATVVPGRALEGWSGGIAHNYEGMDLLEDQRAGVDAWLRRPSGWAGLLLAPAIVAVVGLVRWTWVRRQADPAAVRSRGALRELRRRLDAMPDGEEAAAELLDALRTYLGDKLNMTPHALTPADVRPRLEQRGVDAATCDALARVFVECEAGRYAGGAAVSAGELRTRVQNAAERLEQQL